MSYNFNSYEVRDVLSRLTKRQHDPYAELENLPPELKKRFQENLETKLKNNEYDPYTVAAESLEEANAELFGKYQRKDKLRAIDTEYNQGASLEELINKYGTNERLKEYINTLDRINNIDFYEWDVQE